MTDYTLPSARVPVFWSRVDKNGVGGCWIWTALRHTSGYGVFSIKSNLRLARHPGWYYSRVRGCLVALEKRGLVARADDGWTHLLVGATTTQCRTND